MSESATYGNWQVVDQEEQTLSTRKSHVQLVRRVDDPDGELFVLKTQKPNSHAYQFDANGNEKQVMMDYTDNFREEVELACKIDHPNVIKCVDYNLKDEPWMVTEYCSGGTLRKADFQHWTVNQKWTFFQQICRGTQYLHQMGYTKADTNLQNTFIAEDGRAVIGDLERCQEITVNGGATSMAKLATVFWTMMTGRNFSHDRLRAEEIEKQRAELQAELDQFKGE